MFRRVRWPRLGRQQTNNQYPGGTVDELRLLARAMARHLTLASAMVCGGLLLPPVATAGPFLTRNQNPLLALYGLPSPLPARLPAEGGGRTAGFVNWSNTAKLENSGDPTFTLDAEVVEVRFDLEYAISPKVALRGELPWRQVSGGSLDGFIDNWHQVFGLPNGSRNRLPKDQFLIEYTDSGTTLLRLDESTSGIGDIPVSVGYQLHASDSRSVAAWLTVKAPTGDASDLTGSGAADIALSLAMQSQVSDSWELFGQINGTWLGKGDLLPTLQKNAVWSGLAGVTWNPWRGLDLTVQLEGNSTVFDGGGTQLSGDAVVLTFGGSYRTQGGWQFDLGISEDVQGGASPDIAFNFGVRRGF
jgi:hypothetical protein